MRALLLAALLLAGACTDDFGLPQPPGLRAPQLSRVSPDAAFTADRLVLEGSDLGAVTSVVRVGGRPAEQVPAAPGTLAVLMPDDLPAGPLDVTVTTEGGESKLAGAVRWKGPGHPRALAVRADVYLGATPGFAWSNESVAYVLDRAHDTQIPINPLVGDTLGAPVHVAAVPVVSYGSEETQWVYSMGGIGDHPRLMRFAWEDGRGTRTCDSGDLTLEDSPAKPIEMARASASDEALLLAAPLGGHKVMLVSGDACPPVPRVIDVGDVVASLVVSGKEVIVALSDRFVRITASGEVVAGAPIPVEDAMPAAQGLMALEPGARRLTYLRVDGDLGFVQWDADGGAPVVEDGSLFMYRVIRALGFSAETNGSRRLYVGDVERLMVFEEPAPGARVLASATLDVVQSIASLPDGEVLVTTFSGTALLTRDGTLLRTGAVAGDLGDAYPLAVSADGRVNVRNSFGTHAITPDLQFYEVTYAVPGPAIPLDGLAGADGNVVGWGGEQLVGYSLETHRWSPEVALPAGHAVVQAARSPDGSFVVAGSWDGSTYRLERAESTGVRSIELPDALRARVVFAEGALLVVVQLPSGTEVRRLDPNTLETLGTPVTLDVDPSFTRPFLQVPYWSRALGALLVQVSDQRSRSDGTAESVAAQLFAVRPDGTVLRTPAPLPAMLSNLIGLSPDGRMFVSAGRDPLLDAALVEDDGDELRVRYAGHQELPSHAAAGAGFSTDGASLFVVLPNLDEVLLLQ